MSQIPQFADAPTNLAAWFSTETGRYVFGWEQQKFDAVVADIFGFNAVQIGMPQFDFLQANRMMLRICIAPDGGATLSEPANLPLATGSIDLIVLPHLLEFHPNPHQVLREVERALKPEGQVVITGFNPLSLWGLQRHWMRRVLGRPAHAPWRGNFISLLRIKDWLALLGFEVSGGSFGCYAPPFTSEKMLQRFSFMEPAGDRWWPIAGGVYMLQAIKRSQGMRLLTPDWRSDRVAKRAVAAAVQQEAAKIIEFPNPKMR